MEQPPAPAPSGPTVPKLSTTVLLAMGAIATIVLVAIFAYILLVARLRLDEQLWWTGLTSMIFALGFYIMYAATHDRMIARPLAGGFFAVGAGSFYGSIFTGGAGGLAKLMYFIPLSILVIIVPRAVFLVGEDAGRDAGRQAPGRY